MPPKIRSQRSQRSQRSPRGPTQKLKRAPRLRKLPKKLLPPKSPVVIEARVPRGKLMYQSQFDETLEARPGSAAGQPRWGGRALERRLHVVSSYAAGFVLLLGVWNSEMAQAGRRPSGSTEAGVLVSIVAKRADSSAARITSRQVSVYDNGVEQTIRNFTPDPS